MEAIKRKKRKGKIRVYLEDMKNTGLKITTSEIARTACRNYKEDHRIMDEVKD